MITSPKPRRSRTLVVAQIGTSPNNIVPHLTLTLFGGMSAALDGVPLTFPSDKTRALLAFLVIENSRAHRRGELAGLLWSELSEERARHNLSQTLLRLRQTLGEKNQTASSWFHISATEIQFNAQSEWECDVIAFSRIANRVSPTANRVSPIANRVSPIANRESSIATEAISDMQYAISQYRGDFLAGLNLADAPLFEEWLLVERESLRATALEMLDTLTAQHETKREGDAVILYARRQIEIEAWRERAHRAIMRALARQGDRSGALAQFKILSETLAAELGVEPEAETRALAEQIAANRLDAPAPPSAATILLPTALTPFIGREVELAQLDELLNDASVRLLTLLGLGGMGKTRLALASAASRATKYPDGVYFVSLVAFTQPQEIFTALANALGLASSKNNPRQEALNALRDKHALFVLDNFEQLVAGANALEELLAAAPRVQFVVTSREHLQLAGEQLFFVEGMDLPAQDTLEDAARSSAVRLFVSAARRVEPQWKLNQKDLEAVLFICRHVGGMPLGIELAAAWMELLSPQEIVGELVGRAEFLQATQRNVPARHANLQTIFDWAWDALDAPTRQVFAALAVFRGGFTRHAAESIAGASLRDLARLAGKALIRRTRSSQGQNRYDLHELVRQYAETKDKGGRMKDETRPPLAHHPSSLIPSFHSGQALHPLPARHATYFLEFVSARAERLVGVEPQVAVVEIREDWANLCMAWEWSAAHQRVRELAAARQGLVAFCEYTGLADAGIRLLEQAHANVNGENVQPMDRAQLRLGMAHLQNLQGRWAEAHAAARAILEQARQWDDAPLLAESNYELAFALWRQNQVGAARAAVQRARAEAQKAQLPRVEADAIRLLGAMEMIAENQVAARAYLEQALRLYEQLHDLRLQARMYILVSGVSWRLGEYAQAYREAERALEMARALHDRYSEGSALYNMADCLRMQGQYDEALERAGQAYSNYLELGYPYTIGQSLSLRGFIRALQGDWTAARQDLEQALARFRSLGEITVTAYILIYLALIEWRRGNADAALDLAHEAIRLAEQGYSQDDAAHGHTIKGYLQLERNDLNTAEAAFRRALELRRKHKQWHLVPEPVIGLARVAVAQNDVAAAKKWLDEIWRGDEMLVPDGQLELFQCYWSGVQVLRALHDPRAPRLLETAQRSLYEHCSHIHDAPTRDEFLNVPWHRALIEANSVQQTLVSFAVTQRTPQLTAL